MEIFLDGIDLITASVFTAILIIVSVTDIRFMIIPDAIIIPGIIVAATFRLFIHPLPYWDYIGASLLGSGLFYFAAVIIHWITRKDSIGGGDIKLLALTGFILGLKLSLLSFLLFCFAGMLAGFSIIFFKRNLTIPFGPFISLASLISFYWGNEIINWTINQLII